MENQEENVKTVRRPLFLSLLCVSGFVYLGFISLLFLFILIFNSWSAKIISDYFPEYNFTSANVIIFGSLALLLYLIAFTGIVLIWKLKLSGIFTLLVSLLFISLFPFFFGYGSWLILIIHTIYVLLVIMFFKRFN